jgi:hypothetical protein
MRSVAGDSDFKMLNRRMVLAEERYLVPGVAFLRQGDNGISVFQHATRNAQRVTGNTQQGCLK